MADKQNFVDQDIGERDVSRHGSLGCRAERSVGHAQRAFCKRFSGSGSESDSDSDVSGSTADRLQELEDLRSRKLISEMEYQTKRQKVLNEL